MNKFRLLFADPEENNLNAFHAYFRRIEEYEVLVCISATELRMIMKNNWIHVLIVDQNILKKLGQNFLKMQKANGITTIVVTTHRRVDELEKSLNEGVLHSFFAKPFNTEDLHLSIKQALENN